MSVLLVRLLLFGVYVYVNEMKLNESGFRPHGG